jgi:phosphatidylglycerol:prolipoprotein diacylglycerol transferase
MHPVIIEFGHLAIRWYGVMIALAFLVGMWLAGKEAERKGVGKERIQNFFLYALFGAVIGARLYFVGFSDVTLFWKKPLSVFAIWEGGLAIHGAILGGLLVSFIFARHHRINLPKFLDTLAPSLILTGMPTDTRRQCPGVWFTLPKASPVKYIRDCRCTPRSFMKWF